MNANIFTKVRTWLLAFLILFVWVIDANAEISLLDDTLRIAGYFRHQIVYNMGEINPYNSNPQYNDGPAGYFGPPPPAVGYNVQDDKNWCNLSRTWFVTEVEYEPTDMFKLYGKMRVIWDQTDMLDDSLYTYDSMAMSTDSSWSNMKIGQDDNITAELWEFYADLDFDRLWIRMGRQQIVWGEMVSARILDIVNPLDMSWHFKWEPEEFENIRIPQWMLRAVYDLDTQWASWLEDLYIEGFWNPGDIVPTNNPQIGNPYRQNYQYEYDPNDANHWGGIWQTTEYNDRRGENEYGFRLGYKIGQIAGTLNYAHLFVDDEMSKTTRLYGAFPGAQYLGDVRKDFPRIDVYGASVNYAFDKPLSTVVTFEGTYIPNMPWYTVDCFTFATPPAPPLPIAGIDYIEEREFNLAINFQRFSNIIPNQPFMNVIFQYQFKYVPNADDVKWTPGTAPPGVPNGGRGNTGNIVEKINTDAFVLSLSQDFSYKTYKATCVVIWQPDGAYRINPGFKYSPGDHWRFDVYASWWGGSAYDKTNKSCLNYFYYQDELNFRVTYQF
jgi:hypothetical protein